MKNKQHAFKQPVDQRRNRREMRKYFQVNENENTAYQNLWDAVKAVLRGRFMTIKTYFKKRKI